MTRSLAAPSVVGPSFLVAGFAVVFLVLVAWRPVEALHGAFVLPIVLAGRSGVRAGLAGAALAVGLQSVILLASRGAILQEGVQSYVIGTWSLFAASGVASGALSSYLASLRRRADVLERRVDREDAALAEIGRIISSSLQIEDIYGQFADRLRDLVPFDRLTIDAIDLEASKLTTEYSTGLEIPERESGVPVDLRGTLVEELLRRQTGLMVQGEPAAETARRYPCLTLSLGAGLQSFMSVHLWSRQQVIGVLHLQSMKADAYTQRDLQLAQRVGDQISGAIASSRLYADLERAETELQEAEARYRTLVENATDSIVVLQQGKTIYRNPALGELLGYSLDETAQRSFLDNVVPEDRDRVRHHYESRLKGQPAPDQYELSLLTANGRRLTIEAKPQVINYNGAKATMVVMREVTERRRTEAALRESEDRYRRLVELSPEAVVVHTAGRLVYVNAAAVKLYGASDEAELVGRSVIDFAQTDYREMLIERIQRIEHGREQAAPVEMKAVRLDGQVIDIEGRGTFITYEGKPAVLGVLRDITETKRASERLQEYSEELQRSNSELEQFAYVASHDLREPLRTVTSFTQLLARRYEGELDKDAREFIAYAVGGTKRMQDLIDDLLEYSRIGKQLRPAQPADFNAVFDQSIANLSGAIEENGAKITRDELPTATVNSSQLTQVFQNLVANAIKFRQKAPPRVHVSALLDGADWVFSVADNGIGIDPQYADRIFTIFQRLHTREEYPGTGIGLAVCKKIVEQRGGAIWLDADQDDGTTFKFTIPS